MYNAQHLKSFLCNTIIEVSAIYPWKFQVYIHVTPHSDNPIMVAINMARGFKFNLRNTCSKEKKGSKFSKTQTYNSAGAYPF